MNAYLTYDRIEAQNWTRHYQQIAREEKESELADDWRKDCRFTCWSRCVWTSYRVTAPTKSDQPGI